MNPRASFDPRLAQYLDALQRRTADESGQRPRATTAEYERRWREMFARTHGPDWQSKPVAQRQYIELMKTATAPVPTTNEDPVMYSRLTTLATQIDAVVSSLGMKPELPLLLGTLNSGQVNAVTIRPPDGSGHLVLFERQIFHFALLFSKALARAFPAMEQDRSHRSIHSWDSADIDEWVARNPTVNQRFNEVVAAYAVYGSPVLAPPYPIEPSHSMLANVILVSMELFMLGHEYGHVLLGHTGGDGSRPAPATQADTLAFSWADELQADRLGLRLSMEATMEGLGVDASLAFSGADAFFSALDIMDRATSFLATGDDRRRTLGSHPPAHLRRESVRKVIELEAAPHLGEQAAGPVMMGKAVEHAAEQLWAGARPTFAAMHARGVRPWGSWHLVDRTS